MNIAKKVVTKTGVTFNWADETATEIEMESFPETIINRAAIHGVSQKLGDAYSGLKTVGEAKAALNEVLTALIAGDWNRKGGATGGIWLLAIAKATGEELEVVQAKWDEMDEATRKTVQAHPDVKQAKAEIDLERAQAKVKATDVKPLTL